MLESDSQLTAEFSLDYLYGEIKEAIRIGEAARLFYSVRPLLSFQLRVASARRNYADMSEIFNHLSALYTKLSAVESPSNRGGIEFFIVDGRRVYTVDEGCGDRFREMMEGKSVIKVVQVERLDGESLEHRHCWNVFEVPVDFQNLKAAGAAQQSIRRVQYLTENELPALVMFGDVIRESFLDISLCEHANFETNRAITLMEACAGELDGLFISVADAERFENWKPNCDHAIERLKGFLRSVFVVEESLFSIYKLILGSPDKNKVVLLAKRLWPHLRKIIALYNSGLELVGKKKSDAAWFERPLKEFMAIFHFSQSDLKKVEKKRPQANLHVHFSLLS
jgi:hypothetical protein